MWLGWQKERREQKKESDDKNQIFTQTDSHKNQEDGEHQQVTIRAYLKGASYVVILRVDYAFRSTEVRAAVSRSSLEESETLTPSTRLCLRSAE